MLAMRYRLLALVHGYLSGFINRLGSRKFANQQIEPVLGCRMLDCAGPNAVRVT